MDLLTPGFSLLLWQVFLFLSILLFVIAGISILIRQWTIERKLIWLLIVLCLPILGAKLYWWERRK